MQIKLEQREHMGPSVTVQVVPLSLTQAEWPRSIKQPTKSFAPLQRKPTQRNHICSVSDTSLNVYDLSSVLHVGRLDNYKYIYICMYTIPCAYFLIVCMS